MGRSRCRNRPAQGKQSNSKWFSYLIIYFRKYRAQIEISQSRCALMNTAMYRGTCWWSRCRNHRRQGRLVVIMDSSWRWQSITVQWIAVTNMRWMQISWGINWCRHRRRNSRWNRWWGWRYQRKIINLLPFTVCFGTVSADVSCRYWSIC